MPVGIFIALLTVMFVIGVITIPLSNFILAEMEREGEITEKKGNKIFKVSVIFAIVILIISVWVLVYIPPTKIVLDKTYDIYALNDNVLVKGNRYYITADNKLTFFRDSDEEDGRILDSVSADKSIIFETDEQPRIEIYKDVANSRYKWVNYVFSEVNGIGRDCEYRLYVPKGTIVKEFKMDLE